MIKYVLWDDVLDWERDIKDYGKKKKEIKGQRKAHITRDANVAVPVRRGTWRILAYKNFRKSLKMKAFFQRYVDFCL